MKVDGSVKSLIQGVSQQPRQMRFPGQCTLQENMSSNPLLGLTRRPPLEKYLDLGTTSGAVDFFDFNVGANKYIGMITPGYLKIYKNYTLHQTLALSTGIQTYLNSGSLSTISIDNTTFINSSAVQTAMTSDVSVSSGKAALINLLGGQYGRVFKVTVKWGSTSISVSYTTPNGSTSSDITSISTANIAEKLRAALAACTTSSFNTLFTVTRAEDVIMIKSASITSFNATVDDGEGGTLMKACNNEVESSSDLPRFAPNGYIATISGVGTSVTDNYYVRFYTTDDTTAVGSGFGDAGTWYEDLAPGLPYKIDASTMPVGLQYNSGTFRIGTVDWEDRDVGDDSSNPIPSFIGHTINDMGYFQGRLVFISDPSVTMSRTSPSANSSKVTNFWRESGTTITDSDVIDMQSTASDIGALKKCVPHNRDLIVFSEGAQFIVLGRSALTPTNCSLIETTTFKCDLSAKPVEAGRNIFFGVTTGNFINVREFYTMDSIDANDSRPVTHHCSEYLTGGLKKLLGSSSYDILFVITGTNKVFVYEYLWNDSAKVQSSWSTWILPFTPVWSFMDKDSVHFVQQSGTKYTLHKLQLDVQDDTDMQYKVLLDSRTIGTVASGTMTLSEYSSDMVFIQGTGCSHPGLRVLPKTVTGTGPYTVTFYDIHLSGTIIYGLPYTSRYQPTMPVIKDQDGVAVGTGKFVIQVFLFNCVNTGKLMFKKLSDFRTSVEHVLSPRYANDPMTTIGVEALATKQYKVPFRDNPSTGYLEVYTSEHTPVTINNMEWTGEYKHSRMRMQGNK